MKQLNLKQRHKHAWKNKIWKKYKDQMNHFNNDRSWY